MITRKHNKILSRVANMIGIVVLFSGALAGAAAAAADVSFQLLGPFSVNPVNTIDIRTVVMADFNLDGKNDLATSNTGINTVSVWMGNGDGTIGPATVVATGSVNHWGLASGDVNLDGMPDLVVSDSVISQHYIGVLIGIGNGTFLPLQTFSTGLNTEPRGIVIADVNEDGKPDVAVANKYGGFPNASFLTILIGNGDGTFQPAVSFSAGGAEAYNLAVGDFDGDGDLDAAVSNHIPGTVAVLLGDGAGNFGSPAIYPAGGITPNSVAAGDFNNDGALDLAVVQEFGSVHTLEILKGIGDGTFTVHSLIPFSGLTYPKSVVAADFDVDGNLDLAVGIGYYAATLVLRGNGDLTFDPPLSFSIGTVAPNWSSLAVGKMNWDNMPDIAVANFNANRISVLLNTGDTLPPEISVGVDPAPNLNNWWNTDVTVTFNCTDSGSGVDTFTAPILLSTDGANQSAQGDCFDIAGNTASTGVTGINIDKTLPDLTGGPTTLPNSFGWYSADVTIHWDCGDALSGLADGSPTGDITLTSEAAGQSAPGSCSDLAGNVASQLASGINIDKTPPTLNPSVTPSTIPLNGTATVSANAGDVLSGIDLQSCEALDTGTPGTKTVTCTATDKAGNSASAIASYTVSEPNGFTFSGFFQPVDNLPTVNQGKAGSGIPVKFSLGGDQGLNIFAPGYPAVQQISCDSGTLIDPIEVTVNAGGSSLSYDSLSGQYTYVWKTEKSWTGTCRQLTLMFTDGSQQMAQFKFK